MLKSPFLVLLFYAFVAGSLLAQAPAQRVAMVVGCNHYTHLPEDKQLTAPRNDAADVAAALRAIGFSVQQPVLDGTRDAIINAKNAFLANAKDAQIALFYFSGHGVQVGDEQFLMPSDTPLLSNYTALTDSGIALRQSVMIGLEEVGAKTKIIILDCCRDNPFESQLNQALARIGKSIHTKSGVAPITGYGPGFFLAFATSPGQTALDGNGGRNSPFTSAFLLHVRDKAGVSIRDLLDDVKSTVRQTSGESQVPWVNDSLDSSHVKILAANAAPPRLPISVAPILPASASPPPDPPRPSRPLLLSEIGEVSAENARVAASIQPYIPPENSSPLNQGAVGKTVKVKLPDGAAITFCYCPPGSFLMGSPDGGQEHRNNENQVNVRLSKGFWMAQTELTQAQWSTLMGTTLRDMAEKETKGEIHGEGSRFPMYDVSWEDAQAYVEKMNRTIQLPAGWKVALPTEAQWEYACRAGTRTAFSFGDGLQNQHANFDGDSNAGTTTRVGSYPPNAWGLYDMHGNVWEWCADFLSDQLTGGTDPHGPSEGLKRVNRGGSWYNDADYCRSAIRLGDRPDYRSPRMGFRLALIPTP